MGIVINISRGEVWRGGGAGIVGAALLLAVAGCSGSASGESRALVSVVASTNVYGDIVTELAGRLAGGKVAVTSIITDPAADPHEYEASTRNELAIKQADLVIENGGGYDDFIDRLRAASGSDAQVLNAVKIGARHSDNEHVWYDFPTVAKLVKRVESFLIAQDRADAATFKANARSFIGRLRQLEAEEATIRRSASGVGVAITEPVPLYMLTACGLVNRTPAQFSAAVEEGTDVAPRVLQDALALFSQHTVKVLVYNGQTVDNATDQLRDAAQANQVPEVAVTETLPAGKTYLSWMQANLDAVAGALGLPHR
jgi:zinc/manganese transport system substrate-binding protein